MAMYIVVIEWDGLKVPTGFYHRLKALAARGVRGDKGVPALERRIAEEKAGIIVQEGAIIVPSESLARLLESLARLLESLARLLAMLAREYGAAYVQVGRVHLEKNMAPTPDDIEAMRRVEAVLGRRGRPPKKQVWTVSCRECLTVHRVVAPTPVNCPRCGGVMISVHLGEPPRFADPGTDIWDTWLRTRFARGVWEPAPLSGSEMPPAQVDVESPREHEVVTWLQKAGTFLGGIERLGRQTALQVLDAVFVARAYWTRERRQAARVAAATEYFRRGGDPAGVVLAEEDAPDLLDAAGPLGADVVAGLLVVNSTKIP